MTGDCEECGANHEEENTFPCELRWKGEDDPHLLETGEADDGNTYSVFRGERVGPFRADY